MSNIRARGANHSAYRHRSCVIVQQLQRDRSGLGYKHNALLNIGQRNIDIAAGAGILSM